MEIVFAGVFIISILVFIILTDIYYRTASEKAIYLISTVSIGILALYLWGTYTPIEIKTEESWIANKIVISYPMNEDRYVKFDKPKKVTKTTIIYKNSVRNEKISWFISDVIPVEQDPSITIGEIAK